MKKRTINLITIGTALGLGVLFLSSCTANFCTNLDKANIMFSYDRGTSVYIDEEQKSKNNPHHKVRINFINYCFSTNCIVCIMASTWRI